MTQIEVHIKDREKPLIFENIEYYHEGWKELEIMTEGMYITETTVIPKSSISWYRISEKR